MLRFATCHKPSHTVQEVLKSIDEKQVEPRQLYSLAGPNDMAQLIADAAGWKTIVTLFVGAYGVPFVQQIAKRHADHLWEHRSEWIGRIKQGSSKAFTLCTELLRFHSEGNLTGLALPHGPLNNRNPAAPLVRPGGVFEVAGQIVRFAIMAPLIEDVLSSPALNAKDSGFRLWDAPSSIAVEPDGVVKIQVQYSPSSALVQPPFRSEIVLRPSLSIEAALQAMQS